MFVLLSSECRTYDLFALQDLALIMGQFMYSSFAVKLKIVLFNLFFCVLSLIAVN